MRLVIFSLAASALWGCSAPQPVAQPQSTVASSRQAAASQPTAVAAVPDRKSQATNKTLAKAELKEFLDRGPQEFIQQVQVRPVFRQGKFFGWKIIDYVGPGPIIRGDIVCRVNGQAIERPDEFMSVWNTLGNQEFLEVELQRQTKKLKLRYTIVD